MPALRPVRARFTALQVASLGLPIVLALLFSAWIWTQVLQDARALSARTAELLEEQIARALEVQDAAIAAIRFRMEGMSWDEIATSQDLSALLDRLDAATPNTSRLGIIDPTGTLVQISQVPLPGPRSRHTDRDFVQALSVRGPDRAMLGQPVIGRTSGNLVLNYARPRLDAQGLSDGGVIWGTYLLANLAAMFQRSILGPQDTVMLLRNDGRVLASYPSLNPLDLPPMPPSSAEMRALAAAPPGIADPIRSAVGAGHAQGVSSVDGVARHYAARAIPGVGAALVYGRAASALQAEWLRRSLAVLAVAALSSALLLFLARRSEGAALREVHARDAARSAAEQRAVAEAARADAEAMLRHAQRAEMLGQIAAGIVHDFRNTVQTVHAGVALIERAASQGNLGRVREVADMLRQAATRGGQLTQRLLAFRKGSTAESTCDPAEAAAATCALLHAAVGPAWRLETTMAPALPARITGSQAELDSALMNLVINARDAMPTGGTIAIALQPATAAPGLPDGRYLQLSVTDTGTGMDEATLARATEAFFTTKSGGGTGLGLSSIRGFVDAVGGAMRLQSVPGKGTTVTLWLPAAG